MGLDMKTRKSICARICRRYQKAGNAEVINNLALKGEVCWF